MRSVDPQRMIGDVGRRIAEVRVHRGMTQQQLAEALEVSSKWVQRVEGGLENLTLRSVVAFANVLEVRPVSLLQAPRSRRRPRPGRPVRRS